MQNADVETKLAELTPSLWLAAPSFIKAFIIAALIVAFFPMLLTLIDDKIYYLSGFDIQSKEWYIWIIIFFVSIVFIAPVYKLLELATTKYEFTNHRLYFSRGVLNRKRDPLELVRIRDVGNYKPFIQRLFGLGVVHIDTVDRSHPYLEILGQRKADELTDWIHKLNINERERLNYREFENTN